MRELSLNILDIAKNSVRANASAIGVSIEEDRAIHTLRITIDDNGCGWTRKRRSCGQSLLHNENNAESRTRTAVSENGAEMTGGALNLQSQEGVGTTVTAVFHTDM